MIRRNNSQIQLYEFHLRVSHLFPVQPSLHVQVKVLPSFEALHTPLFLQGFGWQGSER